MAFDTEKMKHSGKQLLYSRLDWTSSFQEKKKHIKRGKEAWRLENITYRLAFVHPTDFLPQQQEPKQLCKHIPLKWRTEIEGQKKKNGLKIQFRVLVSTAALCVQSGLKVKCSNTQELFYNWRQQLCYTICSKICILDVILICAWLNRLESGNKQQVEQD